jgi:hypothetical protein
METGFDGCLLPSEIEKMDNRMEVCAEKLPEDADRPRLGPLTKKYMSNREHCMAADAEIRSVTAATGYQHFVPASMTGALGPDEERYNTPLSDLPDDILDLSTGLKFRSSIHNTKTGETRLEVAWGPSMPSIWPCSDMGSDTWQHKLKLFYKYGIRGSEKHDPPHRTVRNREKALSKAKGTFVKNEFGIVFAYVRGPWNCESNLQLCRGGMKELFKHFTWRMPHLQQLSLPTHCQGEVPAGPASWLRFGRAQAKSLGGDSRWSCAGWPFGRLRYEPLEVLD